MTETMREGEYLWDASGPIDLEVAELERELAPLRWKDRELELGPEPIPVPVAAPEPPRRLHVAVELSGAAAWWPAVVTGLAVAASVLGVFFALQRGPSERSEPAAVPAPVIDPAAPPSPDLKDPFKNHQNDDWSYPRPSSDSHDSVDLKDPFGAPQPESRQVSPDLTDPFANTPRAHDNPRRPASKRDREAIPDLKDPFGKPSEPGPRRESPNLVDPFGNDTEQPPAKTEPYPKPAKKQVSPDLKDPFSPKSDDH